MIRVLVLIAITGFFVGVVALSSAAAIGGPDLAARNWRWLDRWHDVDWDHIDRGPDYHTGDDDHGVNLGGTATREIAWTGGSELDIDVHAEVQFSQVEGPGKVVITGPARLVEKVVLKDGRLSMDGGSHGGRRLEVVITAPGVSRFDVGGASELVVNGFKQDRLALDASGSSEVTIRGATRAISLDASGSSEVDLSGLAAEEAAVDSSGTAEVSLAPKTAAQLDISGASEVTLVTKPANLETDISGAGRLNDAGN